MLDRPGKHVRDRFYASMRMPRKSREVVVGIVIAKIIQQKKRVEILRLAETKRALQLHAGALNRGFRLNDLSNWAE